MQRFVCIHGHFYQPPRENPRSGEIEEQPSASPYHDWNERVTAECYAPNASARILDPEGHVVRRLNNYSRISFNFGPTLLAWMEAKAPEVYAAVLAADRESRERFSGHGSALAQPFNHTILPLSTRRDKEIQIRWGLADFRRRFGREPEGVWLPEAAVDLESLDLLAAAGIRFTLLAPGQAKSEGAFDTTLPYRVGLPSGRSIAVFFYDGVLAQAVAFGGILHDGEHFVDRLTRSFREEQRPQLIHLATDGESYGHHHRFGEMALAYALDQLEGSLTNYGEFLARFPPEREVGIHENSSWSCAHGVERWRSDCGCHTGGGPGWNQAWRAPLREAFDLLRDELAGKTGETSELERCLQLMYTSCGWFFSDLAGIETIQCLRYAGRAIELAEAQFGPGIEERFLAILETAHSNRAEEGSGRQIYERHVLPLRQVR